MDANNACFWVILKKEKRCVKINTFIFKQNPRFGKSRAEKRRGMANEIQNKDRRKRRKSIRLLNAKIKKPRIRLDALEETHSPVETSTWWQNLYQKPAAGHLGVHISCRSVPKATPCTPTSAVLGDPCATSKHCSEKLIKTTHGWTDSDRGAKKNDTSLFSYGDKLEMDSNLGVPSSN